MKNGLLAQWLEQRSHKPPVVGSSPTESTNIPLNIPICGKERKLLWTIGEILDKIGQEWIYVHIPEFCLRAKLRKGELLRCIKSLKKQGYLEFQMLKFGGFEKKINGIAIKLLPEGKELFQKIYFNKKIVDKWIEKHEQELEDFE